MAESSSPSTNAPNTKLFVGNLSYDTTDESLRKSFETCGEIVECTVVRMLNGNSKGYGFIEFKNADDARKAVDTKNDTELDGRNVRVSASSSTGVRQGRSEFGAPRGGRGGNFRGGRGGPYRREYDEPRYDEGPMRRGGRGDFGPMRRPRADYGYGGRPDFEMRGRADFGEMRGRNEYDDMRGGRGDYGMRPRGDFGGRSDYGARGDFGGRGDYGARGEFGGMRGRGGFRMGGRGGNFRGGPRRRNDEPRRPSSDTLNVGNIPFGATEEEIRAVFEEFNPVEVVIPRRGDRGKGYAFVRFSNADDMGKAQKKDKTELSGRTINVNVAYEKIEVPPKEEGQAELTETKE